jgi:hypothetical protein
MPRWKTYRDRLAVASFPRAQGLSGDPRGARECADGHLPWGALRVPRRCRFVGSTAHIQRLRPIGTLPSSKHVHSPRFLPSPLRDLLIRSVNLSFCPGPFLGANRPCVQESDFHGRRRDRSRLFEECRQKARGSPSIGRGKPGNQPTIEPASPHDQRDEHPLRSFH